MGELPPTYIARNKKLKLYLQRSRQGRLKSLKSSCLQTILIEESRVTSECAKLISDLLKLMMKPDPFERGSVIEALNHPWLRREINDNIYMSDREWQDSLWSKNIGDQQDASNSKRQLYDFEEEADGEDLNDEDEEYELNSNESDTNDSVLKFDISFQRLQLSKENKNNRLLDLSLLD